MGINEILAALSSGTFFGLAAWLVLAALATIYETRTETGKGPAIITYGPIVLSTLVGIIAAVMVATGVIAK